MKPCPFCGENEQKVIHRSLNDWASPDYYIRCEYCGAYGPPANSERKAKESWEDRYENP